MNVIYINKKNILNNYECLQSIKQNVKLFPVLKSNAYGHGLKQIVKILKKTDCEYMVVDSLPEYQIVKKYSDKPILLLGETLDENYQYFDFKRTTFCIYNIETLQYFVKRKKDVNIHIFINTGMNREGVDESQIKDFLKVLESAPHINITGVMSHLHSADQSYSDNIDIQISQFKKLYYEIVNAGHTPLWRHIGNTAGLLKIDDEFFNAYRPGLGIYGYNPLKSEDSCFVLGKKLKPAITMTSRIVGLHEVLAGDGVSYGLTWRASAKEIVAVVPRGYAEGLPRSASNKIMFGYGKKYFRQVGNICMNLSICLADKSCKLGDEICIVSWDKDSKNTIQVLADIDQTIVYETLVGFDKSIRREIV